MSKYFDFDAWREERQSKPFIIKAFGKEYPIPNDVPFDVVLGLARAMKDGVEEIEQMNHVLEMAESLFGKETLNEWRANRIGMNEIKFLTEQTMMMYSAQTTNMADEKTKAQGGDTPK